MTLLPDDMNELSCGCLYGIEGNAFVFKACSRSCENYQYMLDESARQGKPVITRAELN